MILNQTCWSLCTKKHLDGTMKYHPKPTQYQEFPFLNQSSTVSGRFCRNCNKATLCYRRTQLLFFQVNSYLKRWVSLYATAVTYFPISSKQLLAPFSLITFISEVILGRNILLHRIMRYYMLQLSTTLDLQLQQTLKSSASVSPAQRVGANWLKLPRFFGLELPHIGHFQIKYN